QDEAGDAASVKAIRAAVRAQLAKLEKDTAARAKALHAKYDAVLSQAQAQLTQHQRLDDALLVKAKRDEVKAAWITPAVTAAVEKAPQTAQTPVAPKTTAADAPRPSTTVTNARNIPKGLIGNWRIRSLQTKWNEVIPFHEDGTFGKPGAQTSGTWKVVGNTVHFDGKRFVLPMNPKGTKVLVDNSSAVQSAEKEE
ncbi:MAG: hypothetical protein ABI318_17225, partial [Chthoniobacteraceae bacterium]